MPIHNWTRVEPGDFHHFHQTWVPLIAAALNRGLLPPEFIAVADRVTGRPIPDVATAPPTARVVQKLERINYVKRASRVVIRHGRGRVVAIIEILSPGNKESRHAVRSFAEEAADVLSQGINLLVVDLFPPTPRDPQGVHKLLLGEFLGDEPFPFQPDKPLTVASYLGGDRPEAYVDPVGVGDPLPSSPIFLSDSDTHYVPAPLEDTYRQAWDVYPSMLKELIEAPPAPARQESP